MTNLLKNPYSKSGDLGKPMPGWPHATSVCMPKWIDNIHYEEGDPQVVNDITCGYPRFIYHPFITELAEKYANEFGLTGEKCLPLPSKKVAEKCQNYIKTATNQNSKIHELGINRICIITYPEECCETVKEFWEHSGEIVSSRQARATLDMIECRNNNRDADITLKNRIAKLADCNGDDIYLFPSGMSAIFNIYTTLQTIYRNQKSIQFGFPYVDTLKIQKKFGCGVKFYPKGDAEDFLELQENLKSHSTMGLFCEFPMNPLLLSPDLEGLAQLAKKHEFPLVVDDTISTCANTSLLPWSDVIVTSLTKFFSGVGDVMGGCVILNKNGKFYHVIKEHLNLNYENNLWPEDSVVLEKNSRDFTQRMEKINHTTEALCDKLIAHPMIENLYYPKFQTRDCYDRYKKEGGGYSGLFSIVVKNPEVNSAIVFDKLNISKGPSLGTCFSLACPYTILAHYDELNFANDCGVSKYLIRVSVGLEEPDDLIERFETTLSI